MNWNNIQSRTYYLENMKIQYCAKRMYFLPPPQTMQLIYWMYTHDQSNGHSMNLCMKIIMKSGTTLFDKESQLFDSFPSGMTQPGVKKGGFQIGQLRPYRTKR